MSSNDFYLVEDDLNFFIYFGLAQLFKEKLYSKSTLESSIQHESKFLDYVKIIEKETFHQLVKVDERDELLIENYGFNITLFNRKLINSYNVFNFIESRIFQELNEINFPSGE